MSLMGVDVGSSSVKVGAYREDGLMLGVERAELTPRHPNPGWWEQDPEEVWQAMSGCISRLMQLDELKRDPPRALAVCASVRENFPSNSHGNPLAPCIMAADIRGEEMEVAPEDIPQPEPWAFVCGHMRERMDPFLRLLWWHSNRPEIILKATHFPGWHEYLALKLCERYAADPAVAGRWQVFDLKEHCWNLERTAEYEINPVFLPEILPWGTIIGEVKRTYLKQWGIPSPLHLAVGTSDLNGAALGAGVSAVGEICLVSGSFENLLVATGENPTGSMLMRGLSMTPHPGPAGRAIWAICPTGTAVLNWARSLTNMSIEQLDRELALADPGPDPVLAIPYLSGAFIYWPGGRKLRGTLLNLTLASTPVDIVRAFMDSIAYDHVNTLGLLREEGVLIEAVRAMGGGSRSLWWTQLKADMMGIPIEVIRQPEPGTLGGALLAGLAIGAIDDLAECSRLFAGISRRHEPDPERSAMHIEKLGRYRKTVQALLDLNEGSGAR